MVIVAIVLGTVLPQVIQTDKPTEAPTPSPQEVLNDLEVLLSSVSFDNGTALQTQSTPQNNALIWLANNTNLNSYSDKKKIQRYTLATLFYSTNGTSWTSNFGWMSDTDECGWSNQGSCENGDIVGLDLQENNVIGTIPNELALLSDSLGKFAFGIDCRHTVWWLVVMIVLLFFIVLSYVSLVFILQLC
jgi:hypothetical protein